MTPDVAVSTAAVMSGVDSWIAVVRDREGHYLEGAADMSLEHSKSGLALRYRVPLDLRVQPCQSNAVVTMMGAPSPATLEFPTGSLDLLRGWSE